ncbi:MAG: hypothetical protein AB7O52_06280 [Planctomycetota bacterium]
MQRLALEAELTAKEKAAQKKGDGEAEASVVGKGGKAATKSKSKSSSKSASPASASGRQKLVWRVLDSKSKVMATFPYPRKAEADAKAAELTAKSGQEHRVRSVKVPLAD